jgi:hypothetical protein
MGRASSPLTMAHWAHRFSVPLSACALGSLASLAGCSSAGSPAPQSRSHEQSEFESVQPGLASQRGSGPDGKLSPTAPVVSQGAGDAASGGVPQAQRTVARGSLSFAGYIQGWGADNGRWNLDFADGKTAHALACGQSYCGPEQALVLATADFSKPDQPTTASFARGAGGSLRWPARTIACSCRAATGGPKSSTSTNNFTNTAYSAA